MARRVLPRGVADLSAVARDGRRIAAELGAKPNPQLDELQSTAEQVCGCSVRSRRSAIHGWAPP